MREILFRGKTPEGKWVEGLIGAVFTADENRKPILRDFIEFDCLGWTSHTYVYDETVGQFTGLTDKNGKKIFEGDIIRSLYMNCPKNEHIEKATFFDGRFMAENATGSCYGKIAGENSPKHFTFDKSVYMIECEIIGNIHDNPELLKGGAE